MELDENMKSMVQDLRKAFESGITLSYAWRKEQLLAITSMLKVHKKEFMKAMTEDLRKPDLEADMCELALIPVLNALAAGNVVVLKPSELTPSTSALLTRLLPAYVDRRAIRVVEGAVVETTALLNQKWDMIFFTGSETVGRIVNQAAAKHLTPCILELGGKSPVVIDKSVRDIDLAARRVVWGKLVNAGQTCIAPDYVLCHREVYPQFLEAAKKELTMMMGEDLKKTQDLARIVSERHAQRLAGILADNPGKIEIGGEVSVKDKYVAPTIVSSVRMDSKMMQEEIFGPLLPVLEVGSLEEAVKIIRIHPNPLALYVFAHQKAACDYIVAAIPSGGVCLNDTLVQFACGTLPFGGVGASGVGHYHGRYSYEAFTHARGVLSRWDYWLGDIPLRYAPYTPFKHKVFRTLVDSLAGVELPGSVAIALTSFMRVLLMGLGVLYLFTLAQNYHQA